MLIRAGGGAFRKLSIPRDSYAEIPGHETTKINAGFAFGGAALQIKTVEKFLNVKIDHVAIVDFTGFEDLINAVGGVEVNVPHKLCADISGGAGGGQGGVTLRLHKGENTLDGEKALAYSRVREPSECPGPGKSAYSFGYNDFNRAQAQQAVVNGIKDRLTDPLRLPYNFIHGPMIGWDAPKAFVSDMGFLTMPQLVLSAAFGGSGPADVLCAKGECTEGPGGSQKSPTQPGAAPSTACSTASAAARAAFSTPGCGQTCLGELSRLSSKPWACRRRTSSRSIWTRRSSRTTLSTRRSPRRSCRWRRRPSSSCRSRCCRSRSP